MERGSARRRDTAGFTLVELLVVVMIIGVLVGIAIPTFQGARSRSQDAVAKTSLEIAYKAVLAETLVTDFQDSDVSPSAMARLEGSLDYVDGDQESTDAKQVSVWLQDALGIAARSDSGMCFYLRVGNDSTGVRPSFGATPDGDCSGRAAMDGARNPGW